MPALGKMPWRREAGNAPGNDLSAVDDLDLIDATLVTEFAGQPAEVPSLGLGFNASGLTVRNPDGVTVVTIPWGAITSVSADVVGTQRHSLSTAVSLDIHSTVKTHRFFVPNVQPGALTGSLSAISSKAGYNVVATASSKARH